MKNKEIFYHISSWAAFVLVIGMATDEFNRAFLVKSIAGFFPAFVLFYINILLIFPTYLQKKKFALVITLVVLAMAVTVLIRPMIKEVIASDLKWPFDGIAFWVQFRLHILFTGISFGYWYAKQNHQNEQKSKLLEKKIADARLALLKNQINPHFLYNTLNLIYSKALPLSDELAKIIGKLSEMLRYSLEETEADGMVPLAREIKYLNDFIEIHQARFNNSLFIDFQVIGNVSERMIAQLMLITFVENAFKHGNLKSAKDPLKIRIIVDPNSISFQTENIKYKGIKDDSSGIGLENIKKRLKIIYPKNHQLILEDTENTFRVNLKIWNKN